MEYEAGLAKEGQEFVLDPHGDDEDLSEEDEEEIDANVGARAGVKRDAGLVVEGTAAVPREVDIDAAKGLLRAV